MKKRWITPCFDGVERSSKRNKHISSSSTNGNQAIENINGQQQISGVTWIDKYKPQNLDDLVIHPKKVDEVQIWFDRYKRNTYSCKYLLLLGPSGSGKTSTINVIAKSNKIKVIEWITPLDRDYNPDLNEEHRSILQIFKSFLLQATRYPTLFGGQQQLKVILVKDFPNIFLHNPSSFHEIMINFYSIKSHPVIFICNDEMISRKLFPNDVKGKCKVEIINFNPVHSKAVQTALKRILTAENEANKITIRSSDLEKIYRQTEGDLRSAILKLYFNFVNQGDNKIMNELDNFKRWNRMLDSNATEIKTNKDDDCGLFVGVGRVIYSKRNVNNVRKNDYSFVHNPTDIADTFLPEAGNFLNFLQENYLSRFSAINDVAMASEALSLADNLSSFRHVNEDTDSIMLEVACRGLMAANNEPVKSFKPIVKPAYYGIKSRKEILDEKRSTYSHLEYDSSSDIILYILPFVKYISCGLKSEQHIINRITGYK